MVDRNIPNQALSSPLGSSPFDRALALRDRALSLFVRRTAPEQTQKCKASEIADQYAGIFPDAGDFTEGGGAQPNTDCPADPAPTPEILFGDCFPECSGLIGQEMPGPVCGWLFDHARAGGYSGGSFFFTPGAMTVNTPTDSMFPGVIKLMEETILTLFNKTAQFRFLEFQTPPNDTTTYLLCFMSSDSAIALQIAMFGDGSLIVQVGDPAAIPSYLGNWTPNGGEHNVRVTVDSGGVPSLYIDGVLVEITFLSNLVSDLSLLPANHVSFYGGSGANGLGESPIYSVFLVEGVWSPETVFDCPV